MKLMPLKYELLGLAVLYVAPSAAYTFLAFPQATVSHAAKKRDSPAARRVPPVHQFESPLESGFGR